MKKFMMMSTPVQKGFNQETLKRPRGTIDTDISMYNTFQHTTSIGQFNLQNNISSSVETTSIKEKIKEVPLPFNYFERVYDNIGKQQLIQHKNTANEQIKKKEIEKGKEIPYLEQVEDSCRRGKELKERLEMLMAFDNQKSQPYKQSSKTIPDGYLNIGFPLVPCAVSKPHIQLALTGQYVYGLIESIGFCFYAVDNIVYFEDLVSKIQNDRSTSGTNLQKIEFKYKVLSIKEGQFNSVRFQKKDRVFFIEYPNGMSICKYKLTHRQISVVEDKLLIGSSFEGSHIHVSNTNRAFYLTKFGSLVQIVEEKLTGWINAFQNRKYYLKTSKHDEKIKDFIKRGFAGSFTNTFKYFGKHMKSAAQSVFNSVEYNHHNWIITSILNDQLKTITCLVRTRTGVLYKCFSFDNVQVKCDLVLQEKQLYYQLCISREMRYLGRQTRLDLPDGRYEDANLLLTFRTGLRIYIKATTKGLTKIGEIYPPSIDSFYENFNKDFFKLNPIESSRDKFTVQKMISYKSVKNNTFMAFMGTESPKIYSYFLTKQNHFQNETISSLQFEILNIDNQLIDYNQYYQSFQFSTISQSLLVQRQYNFVFKLQAQNMKYNRMKTQQLHQFAKQVHFNSQIFVFGSNKGTELKYKMRMIDVMFLLIITDEITNQDIQKFFLNLIETFSIHPTDIASMFLQILIDRKGVYQIETKFITNFLYQIRHDKTRRQLFEFQNGRQHTIKIAHKDLTSVMWRRIDLLLSHLANYSQCKSMFKMVIDTNLFLVDSFDAFYHSYNEPKDEGLLLYFARLVRPLWYVSLNDIQSYLRELQDLRIRIDEVYRFSLVRPMETRNNKEQSKIQHTFKEIVERSLQIFEICRLLIQVPNISFSECLYKTRQEFEEYFILAAIRGQDIDLLTKEGKKSISHFVSNHTFKALSFYLELNNLKTLEQIMVRIKQLQSIPFYIHDYLVKYRQLPLTYKIKTTTSIIPLHKQKQKQYVKQLSPYESLNINVDRLFKQLDIKKKQKVVDKIGTTKEQQIRKIQNQIKALYVQNVLLSQQEIKMIEIDQEVVKRLKQDILTQVEIRTLVMNLSSKLADIVFMLNFTKKVESVLLKQLILENLEEQIEKKKLIINRMKYVTNNTYQHDKNEDMLTIFIEILCQYQSTEKPFVKFFTNIVDEQLNNNKHTNKDLNKEIDRKIQIFWIVYSLFELGYSRETIQKGLSTLIKERFSLLQTDNESQMQDVSTNKPVPLKVYSLILTYIYYLKFVASQLIRERKEFVKNIVTLIKNNELLNNGEALRLIDHIYTQLEA